MTPLLAESWIWWGFVMFVAICRFVSRRMVLGGVRHYQWDDYLMLVTLCFYTTFIVVINIVSHTASNLLPPGFEYKELSESDIKQRQFGSKLILVVEECQIAAVWGAKACLLIMYMRLTTFRWENIAIKVVAGYVAFGFILMEILYLGVWCRPFHEYWAVPTTSIQCSAATDHLITNAVLNISSDCAMLIIGLPMFLRMRIPWRKKIPLILIFSLGIFVVLAAIFNKVYSFTQPFGSMWTYWYTRESSTALLVANLVFIWGVVKKVFGLRSQNDSHDNSKDLYDPRLTDPGDVHENKLRFDSMINADSLPPKAKDGADLEMAGALPHQPERQSITFEQMLEEHTQPYSGEGEPNVYTHPMMYFARNPSGLGYLKPQPPIEKAVVRDSGETVRRTSTGSGSGEGRRMTPATSTGPSLNSRRSEGSFV